MTHLITYISINIKIPLTVTSPVKKHWRLKRLKAANEPSFIKQEFE